MIRYALYAPEDQDLFYKTFNTYEEAKKYRRESVKRNRALNPKCTWTDEDGNPYTIISFEVKE